MYRGHLSNPGKWPLTCGYRARSDWPSTTRLTSTGDRAGSSGNACRPSRPSWRTGSSFGRFCVRARGTSAPSPRRGWSPPVSAICDASQFVRLIVLMSRSPDACADGRPAARRGPVLRTSAHLVHTACTRASQGRTVLRKGGPPPFAIVPPVGRAPNGLMGAADAYQYAPMRAGSCAA